jgi:hypothetical protein
MISREKIFPLFLASLLAAGSLLSFSSVIAETSRFSWLQVGSYAKYSYGGRLIGSGGQSLEPGTVGFDDSARGEKGIGNYSWHCIELDDDYAKLIVEINLTFTISVIYWGKEFFEKAQDGDLSFIKRIPIEQVVGRIELVKDQGVPEYVYIDGPIYIYESLVVKVDLDTLELVDEDGNPWGKWVLWINPLKYPLQGENLETFVMNWLNTTMELNIGYYAEGPLRPVETAIGTFGRWFWASGYEAFENEFLLTLRISEAPRIFMTYRYEPRSGILLDHSSSSFLDDIFTQKLGIIYTSGGFIISETNITIEQDSGFNLSPYIPYIAIPAISGIIIATYLIKKKKHLQP